MVFAKDPGLINHIGVQYKTIAKLLDISFGLSCAKGG